MSNITLPPVNTAVVQPTTTSFNGTAATANLQTGFSAQNTFGTGGANFAALGSPDQVGGTQQTLTALIDSLTKIVSVIGDLVKALQAGGGAQDAKEIAPGEKSPTGGAEAAKPAEGGGGAEAAKPAETKPAETKPAEGGGAGGAAPAAGAGGGAQDILGQLGPILQTLTELIKQLTGQGEEDAKADTKGKAHAKKGAHKTHASETAKKHANANSAVGQQAAAEKLQQAVTQLLTAVIQMLGPVLQQLAAQLGKDNPQVQAATQGLNDVMGGTRSGGGLAGGVLAR